MNNLWPDFDELDDILTPKDILSIQAGNLNTQTKGLLQGIIKTTPMKSNIRVFGIDFPGDSFWHRLIINSPKLNYSFDLLSVLHETIRIYPCYLVSDIANTSLECGSREILEVELKKLFYNADVANAVRSLFLQSRKETHDDDDLPF